MNSNIVNLHDKIVGDFMPVAERMAAEGCSRREIMRAFKNHIGLKTRKTHKQPPMKRASSVVGNMEIFTNILKNKQNADSNTERILYDLLVESGICFKFQQQIGPYKVDFLINSTVIELDGPHHKVRKLQDRARDKYLIRRGYNILRIPVYIFDIAPEAVLAEIREKTGEIL